MYIFGGWIPVPESDKHNALGAEWICTNSLNVLNFGQYISLQIYHTLVRVVAQSDAFKRASLLVWFCQNMVLILFKHLILLKLLLCFKET